MNKEIFIEEIKKLNIVIDNNKMDQLDNYYKLLIEWNKKINLTSVTKEEEVYLKHFYDSLTLTKAIDLNNKISVCDIGTGAGFPGLVLKIFFPNISLTLVDSLGKRVSFLKEVVKKLNISNITIENMRGEEYIKSHRESFDLITCRALSKMNIISEICLPGVKIGGHFIPMKGNIEEETNNKEYIKKLGGTLEKIISVEHPIEKSKRNLVIIKKINSSNFIYPRDYASIIKRPL